jgi:3'-phosphoadenosine 5'-phosphosulfate sulfotransferase (PAPS reductase)/FAD synthetase
MRTTLTDNEPALTRAEHLLACGCRPVAVHGNPDRGQLALVFDAPKPARRALPVVERPFLTAEAEALAQVCAGALVAVNHSGGKDSQAMLIRLLRVVPREQLVVVHAPLRGIEWAGASAKARDQAAAAGVPFLLAAAGKTFLELVEHRHTVYPDVPAWPSPSNRQCTSDLKRDPVMREVRRYAKARGYARIITALGLRAQESSDRAEAEVWARDARGSLKARGSRIGRDWYTWLPIHHLSEGEVFATIKDAGQSPHWAYAKGNERLSCMFCFFGSANDLRNAAIHNPELYARYLTMEARTGYTMHPSRRPLQEIVGLTVAQARALHAQLPAVERAMLAAEDVCELPPEGYVLPGTDLARAAGRVARRAERRALVAAAKARAAEEKAAAKAAKPEKNPARGRLGTLIAIAARSAAAVG